jgi:hypothetical protein
MKQIFAFVLLLLTALQLSAQQRKAVLYNTFLSNYRAEMNAQNKFPITLLNACEKTLSITQTECKEALKDYPQIDSGLLSLCAYVTERFFNENIWTLECKEDTTDLEEVLALYTERECLCITNKAADLKRKNISIELGNIGMIEGCMREISQDHNLTLSIRAMGPDIDKLNNAGHCQLIFAYLHCPVLKQELISTCRTHVYAHYKKDLNQNDENFALAIKHAIQYNTTTDLKKFFANTRHYTLFKKEFENCIANYATKQGRGTKEKEENLVYVKQMDNGTSLITFISLLTQPEIILQVKMQNVWNPYHDKILKPITLIEAAKVQNKNNYLNYYKENDKEEEAPPIRGLK